ncbi:hypothetical protein [Pseudomonas phage 98PfluR60PP]|uniref:Uncharacterized protein n=1 Tax=Pseudomonas phage 98PfluR60PP TaxID=2163965 RepID=A0A2S1PFV8_9CAUD|nr:hypothetical protein PP760_gp24 [Pseudomonas phage 98PfluR60PP]AWH15456.1 hypothetical protein [Pseudomonas phage 98PfluR60PP]
MADLSKLEQIKSPTIVELEQKARESLDYLNNTDWYVTRWVETNESVPNEVTVNRATARQTIKEYKNAIK